MQKGEGGDARRGGGLRDACARLEPREPAVDQIADELRVVARPWQSPGSGVDGGDLLGVESPERKKSAGQEKGGGRCVVVSRTAPGSGHRFPVDSSEQFPDIPRGKPLRRPAQNLPDRRSEQCPPAAVPVVDLLHECERRRLPPRHVGGNLPPPDEKLVDRLGLLLEQERLVRLPSRDAGDLPFRLEGERACHLPEIVVPLERDLREGLLQARCDLLRNVGQKTGLRPDRVGRVCPAADRLRFLPLRWGCFRLPSCLKIPGRYIRGRGSPFRVSPEMELHYFVDLRGGETECLEDVQ